MFVKGGQKMYEIFEQLLQKYGVSAYKVAKATGVTQSTLSDWKRGRSTPKSENMKKLADYFGVSIDYLMTGKEETEKEPKLKPKDEKDINWFRNSDYINRIMISQMHWSIKKSYPK